MGWVVVANSACGLVTQRTLRAMAADRSRSCYRALALKPAFIVCDEPTSGLDVSIRAQIINLLQDLHAARWLSHLMISHDLGVGRHISNAVAVMYLGKIVEQAPTETLYNDPRHPYTKVLLSAIQVIATNDRRCNDAGEVAIAAKFDCFVGNNSGRSRILSSSK